MTLTIGIDIGGTKIAGGLIDRSGAIVREARRDTDALDIERIVAACADLVGELRKDGDPGAIGLSVAGYIDAARERVMYAPNIAFRDEPLKTKVEEATGLPTILENDANAAAYGEFRVGGAAAFDSMVMLTLGTGVGGGIVTDGQVWRGAFGVAGELGHLRVVPDGQLCGCGNHGCLEAYASGTALVRDGRALVVSSRPASAALAALCDGDPDKLTGPMITQAAHDGDPAAIELFGRIGRWVGEAAATLTAVIDPQVFVIGGGVAEAGDLLIDAARAAYVRQLSGEGHRPMATFALAELGNDAGMIGAGLLAMEAVL